MNDSSEQPRLNVLLFAVDAMRAEWMGLAGNPMVQTPHLDALAASGVYFPRAYCNHPICMPARCSLFSGLLPRDHGVWSNNMEMHPRTAVLPELLRQHGYRTHGIGKLHLSRWCPHPDLLAETERFPESLPAWNNGTLDAMPVPYYGFEQVDMVGGHGDFIFGPYLRWLEEQQPDARVLLTAAGALVPPTGTPQCYKMGLPAELHYNQWIADRTIASLRQAQHDDRPFFLWCSFPDPHAPFCPPAPYCHQYDPREMPLPARRDGELDSLPPFYRALFAGSMDCFGEPGGPRPDREWQEKTALSYAMVSHVDAAIGRVLTELKRSGLWDNTVVGFVSDHGSDMLGDHWMSGFGSYAFDAAVRIPFLLRLPGGATGLIHHGLVSQLDLLPTILDLCEITHPDRASATHRHHPYRLGQWQPLRVLPGTTLRGILTGDNRQQHEAILLQNDEPYLGFKARTLVTDRYKITLYAGSGYGELFDLQNDPQEFHNLWADAGYASLRSELSLRLLDEGVGQASWQPVPWWTA